jgi:hypothetical protein
MGGFGGAGGPGGFSDDFDAGVFFDTLFGGMGGKWWW